LNYLAHSFLAFSDGQITGQFLEDYIRNSERFSFPKEIQKGISLHRAVDTFTDTHPEISEAKKIFSPLVRLYSGAFVDVAMDYFLANDEKIFPGLTLKEHSKKIYSVLKQNLNFFPESFHQKLQRMENDDWLYNYRENWGIDFSMQNVLNKAKYLEKDIPVFHFFLENKEKLQNHYDHFFPDLLNFTKNVEADLG